MTAITQECYELYWTNPGGNIPQNSSSLATFHPSRKLFKLDGPDMRDTAREVRTNSSAMYFGGPLHMDKQRLNDQLEPINNSSVLTQYLIWTTCREWWTSGEKGPGKSVLAAWHEDDESFIVFVMMIMTLLDILYIIKYSVSLIIRNISKSFFLSIHVKATLCAVYLLHIDIWQKVSCGSLNKISHLCKQGDNGNKSHK